MPRSIVLYYSSYADHVSRKKSSQNARRDTWCVTSEVEYFGGLKKQPVNQVLSTERTIIYSKVLMSCGCHSFPKPVKKLVLYCTISLYICTRYLDVAYTLFARELDNKYLYVPFGMLTQKDESSAQDSRALLALHYYDKNILFFTLRIIPLLQGEGTSSNIVFLV